MDLWIMGQDEETLVKANALWIIDNQIWMEVPFYESHKKLGLCVTGHNHKLATYKTKERAVEVLKEIQNKLSLCLQANSNERIVGTSCYVYEMPKE